MTDLLVTELTGCSTSRNEYSVLIQTDVKLVRKSGKSFFCRRAQRILVSVKSILIDQGYVRNLNVDYSSKLSLKQLILRRP